MIKEFCLEDKIIYGIGCDDVIITEDVRKFIKKLKEKGKTRYKNPFGKPIYILTGEEINKLAGKKLSEVEK